MRDYVIDTDFIFFNEETTPLMNLLECDTKIVKSNSLKSYNPINKWIMISERDDNVVLTILPDVNEHGKLFIAPPISFETAKSFAYFIKGHFKKEVYLSYIVFNSDINSLNSECTKSITI